MTENSYNVIKPDTGVPIKVWGVPLEDAARKHLLNVAQLGDRRDSRQRDPDSRSDNPTVRVRLPPRVRSA